jgi:hypothetical protein
MAGHTGQSSQLFADATSRNALFLATAARSEASMNRFKSSGQDFDESVKNY